MSILRSSVLCFPFLLAALYQPASAQTIDDVGQWNALFAQDRFSPDSSLKWWFDGHYRLFDDNGGFGQSIIRPGIGIDVTENSALWAGYGWIRTSPIEGADTDEHRWWQQWTWSESLEPLKFSARTRFEQRLTESFSDTGLRLRQFFRGQTNLGPCSKHTFVVWDELFLALNDTDFGQRSGFDQNRVFVGFGLKAHHAAKWRVEIGYMNQFINQIGQPDRSNHLLAVNVFAAHNMGQSSRIMGQSHRRMGQSAAVQLPGSHHPHLAARAATTGRSLESPAHAERRAKRTRRTDGHWEILPYLSLL